MDIPLLDNRKHTFNNLIKSTKNAIQNRGAIASVIHNIYNIDGIMCGVDLLIEELEFKLTQKTFTGNPSQLHPDNQNHTFKV